MTTKTPEGLCPICWENKVAAVLNGPTCPHGKHVKDGKFNWETYWEEMKQKES